MGFKTFCFKKSLWLFHFGGASCNNCDIEILDCLTPKYDVERFGMVLVGSVRHADVLLVNGSINKKDKPGSLRSMNRRQNRYWWWLLEHADVQEEFLQRETHLPGR